jgi:hypothetical protein
MVKAEPLHFVVLVRRSRGARGRVVSVRADERAVMLREGADRVVVGEYATRGLAVAALKAEMSRRRGLW